MDHAEERRTRLAELLDLAQNYRGCTRKDLAKALRRDPTKLIPGSGVPKLDLVVDLARVLDWPVNDVVDHLYPCPTGDLMDPTAAADVTASDFEEFDDATRAAHRQGDFARTIELAAQAHEFAETPEHHARACIREAAGWDAMGRFTNELEAIQRGLSQHPISPELRRMLQSNLANAYYALWSLVEARAIAGELLNWFAANPPATLRDRKTLAFAHYVAGHTCRRQIAEEPERSAQLATIARDHLVAAREQYTALADEHDDDTYRGIANTCRGGLYEVEVALKSRHPLDALKQLEAGLDALADGEEISDSDLHESYGWWCIFGCNIALRHLGSERELQQYMALFTMKADEIAERLDNWSIRERVFTMEHSRWERAVGCTGFEIPRVVDEDDIRSITGAMARFPTFRGTGWEILRTAQIVPARRQHS